MKADAPDPTLVDAAIEALDPPPDSPGVPRQQPITVDLLPGWTGTLQINGIEIPEDQLLRTEPLNQFSFQPGPGKEIERLPPGDVLAVAIIWRPLDGGSRDNPARSFRWTFRVS